jgi:hypothetical protein
MPKGEGSVLLRFVRAIDRFTEAVGRVVAWLIIPMVLSLVWEVTARYGFNAPTEWAYDMTFMLYGTFFMLGSAWTLQRGGHIRTDSFYSKWTPRTQARVDLVCYLVSSSRPSRSSAGCPGSSSSSRTGRTSGSSPARGCRSSGRSSS